MSAKSNRRPPRPSKAGAILLALFDQLPAGLSSGVPLILVMVRYFAEWELNRKDRKRSHRLRYGS
jgi:hypothetical protein